MGTTERVGNPIISDGKYTAINGLSSIIYEAYDSSTRLMTRAEVCMCYRRFLLLVSPLVNHFTHVVKPHEDVVVTRFAEGAFG